MSVFPVDHSCGKANLTTDTKLLNLFNKDAKKES